ncbi:MAG: hypothetical protein DRN15_06285 [Thermoprotei archaeon]|nr:MAG: hypothetical protein DRN15_06285 [Thermoprotei archaeon]
MSDIVFEESSRATNKILGLQVKTLSNEEIEVVEDLVLNQYDAIKYVIVKRRDGMLIWLKADRLILSEDTMILQEPRVDKILDAMREISIAYMKLIDVAKKLNDGKDYDFIGDLHIVQACLKRALDLLNIKLIND